MTPSENQLARLCVFCGTNAGTRPDYAKVARRLGEVLAREEIELVYGGASVGIMGELADAVQEHGGQVTGVIPQRLVEKEAAHTGIGNLIVVASMHQRKAQMSDLADGFIALPGGIGTLEGFLEIVTWGQLGIHAKPCGLLNVAGYFDLLTGWLDHGASEGFVTELDRKMILVDDDPARLVARMREYQAPEGEPLMERANR